MTGQAGHDKCVSCGHRLFYAVSKARGYGWGCWARIRKAAREAMQALTVFTARQVEQARELIEDCALVPGAIRGLFHAVSTDGREVYEATAETCSCQASKGCYHRAAVIMVTA